MKSTNATKISKFLSLVLRHKPEVIGIELDESGWTSVETLLEKCAQHGKALSREELDTVVETNDKKRFEQSEDGRRIRASQGHSVDVNLGYKPTQPPERLYHGTARRNLTSIRERGLERGQRHHVHLSTDPGTAVAVGTRYGKPVVVEVRSGEMAKNGYPFFLSTNGVWLTDEVPVAYLLVPSEET